MRMTVFKVFNLIRKGSTIIRVIMTLLYLALKLCPMRQNLSLKLKEFMISTTPPQYCKVLQKGCLMIMKTRRGRSSAKGIRDFKLQRYVILSRPLRTYRMELNHLRKAQSSVSVVRIQKLTLKILGTAKYSYSTLGLRDLLIQTI